MSLSLVIISVVQVENNTSKLNSTRHDDIRCVLARSLKSKCSYIASINIVVDSWKEPITHTQIYIHAICKCTAHYIF